MRALRIYLKTPYNLSDVLTPLSDWKRKSVEKMDRKILGVAYMCGMDFHNGILCCWFLCARIVSLYFSTLFLPLSCVYSVFLLRLQRQGLPRPINNARAITPGPLHGYYNTPVYFHPGYLATDPSSISGLSHLSCHPPPHTQIGLSHPP